MKRVLLLIIVIFLAFSCSKQLSDPHASPQSTTAPNLQIDGTGVTLLSAQSLALQFLQNKSPDIAVTIKDAETITKNGKPYFHVINTNAGFVILSPDSLYSPILAYDSISNFSFTSNKLNPGLIMWLNKHAHQLDLVRSQKSAYLDSIGSSNKILWQAIGSSLQKAAHNAVSTPGNVTITVTPPVLISTVPAFYMTNTTVGPLCATQWGQDYPYNQYCPAASSLSGTNYAGYVPAGCVPVAMAQIMYFWKYPGTYNWSSMVPYIDPNNSSTWPAYNPGGFTESARLIHDIGTTEVPKVLGFTSEFVSYGAGGSSADDTYCPSAFSNFGYPSASRTETISDQILSGAKNGTSYAGLLINEISANHRPCMVGGYPSENNDVLFYIPTGTGHEWVCDGSNVSTYYSGYTNTYKSFYGVITTQTIYTNVQTYSLLHMNWGWDGQYEDNNGWYNAAVDYANSDPTQPDYQYFQTIIYNIYP